MSVQLLSCVQLSATLWTCQVTLSTGFSRQEHWSGVLQGIFLTQGLNLCLLHWQADPLLLAPPCVCAQSCPALRSPTDCSPPGSSVYGIFQASILEWVDIFFSSGSSRPRDRTCLCLLHLLHQQVDSLPLAPPENSTLLNSKK